MKHHAANKSQMRVNTNINFAHQGREAAKAAYLPTQENRPLITFVVFVGPMANMTKVLPKRVRMVSPRTE